MIYEKSTTCLKHVSWTAVFVGAFVGVGLSFLLHLFSMAIGLSILNTQSGTTSNTIAIGGLIAVIICVLVSMFVTGWTAGYLGRPFCSRRNLGVVHGFTAWVLALLIGVLCIVPLSHYVAAYTKFISNPAEMSFSKSMAPAATTTSDDNKPAAPATPEDQKAVSNLTKIAFIVFVLFFIGALAACFGGHAGMAYRRDEECDDINKNPRVNL